MPFPIVHGLFAASLYATSQPTISIGKDWKRMLLCAALAILPDADFILEWGFDLRHSHRGFTHSVAFCVVTGLITSFLVGASTYRARVPLVLAPVSHGFLDALVTNRMGAGIQLLWPFSDQGFKLGLIDYFYFRMDPRVDPWSAIVIRVLEVSLLELVVLGPLFTLLLLFKLRKQQNRIPA